MFDLRPGDYVECFDNRPRFPTSDVMPELDRLYTIDAVNPVPGGFGIRLNEVMPTCHEGGPCACGSCGWDAARFRLVYRPEPRKLRPFTRLLQAPVPAIADPVPSQL